MYGLPQAGHATLSPGPLSQQQCPAGCHQHLGRTQFSWGGEAWPPILIDPKVGWEVLEPISCSCPTYLIIGAEVKGSDVLLVLLEGKSGHTDTMKIGCPSTLAPHPGSPRPYLLQAPQHSPRGHIQDVDSGTTDAEEVLPGLVQLGTEGSQPK